jgi:hypothetical protein
VSLFDPNDAGDPSAFPTTIDFGFSVLVKIEAGILPAEHLTVVVLS